MWARKCSELSQETLDLITILPLTSFVTLGKSLTSVDSNFLFASNGVNTYRQLISKIFRINELQIIQLKMVTVSLHKNTNGSFFRTNPTATQHLSFSFWEVTSRRLLLDWQPSPEQIFFLEYKEE